MAENKNQDFFNKDGTKKKKKAAKAKGKSALEKLRDAVVRGVTIFNPGAAGLRGAAQPEVDKATAAAKKSSAAAKKARNN